MSKSRADWFAKRFEKSETKSHVQCEVCHKDMWFPKSKAGKYFTCGDICSKARRDAITQSRSRNCKTCWNLFIPRIFLIKSGRGYFCSQKCNFAGHKSMHTKEAREKAAKSFLIAIDEGRYTPPKGEDHPRWRGGLLENKRRRVESGAIAEYTRKWREKNPFKYRQQILRRRGYKIGRLPAGTVEKIGGYQCWKCVVCKKNIRQKYHVDHIVPLAKGGDHSPTNIQLLCPSCNVRKSAKDPITFMQERGFLL